MKQQDAYKILAAFLVLTMLGSVFAYIFIGSREDTQQETQQEATDKYNPEFWTVNQPFNSISDSLNLTPPGAVTAQFVDLETMPPDLMQWTRKNLQIIQEVDSLYKSNTTRMYYARIQEGNNDSFLLLSTMFPMKNDFDYIVLPNTDYVLQRQDTGAINIMGTPVIYAPDQTAGEVMQIMYGLNKSNTSYDQYKNLLANVEPAPYQVINTNITYAKEFYMGIRMDNGSYERTTAFLDANSSILKDLDRLKANSTQNGITSYNITKSGNYTFVKIVSPELSKVLIEGIY